MSNLDKNIKQELQEIAPSLASLDKNIPKWALDNNYFDGLSLDILKKINKENFNNSFKIPEQYFDNLSNNIFDKIKTTENGLIDNIGNPYEVSKNYFESLPAIINAQLFKPKAKILQMKRTWAAAASVILLLSISVFFFYKPSSDTSLLASKEIIKEGLILAKNENNLNNTIDNLSANEIEIFLDEQENVLPVLDIAQSENNEAISTADEKEDDELNDLMNELEETI